MRVAPVVRGGSKAIVLQALRMHGAMPRSRLAQVTGLSRATISGAVADLIRLGLVTETEDRQMTGGRPAVNVQLTPGTRAILGADLDEQGWTLAAFDLLGNTLQVEHVAVSDIGNESNGASLLAALAPFVRRLSIKPVPLLGLGVPGLVDSDAGRVLTAPDVGWVNADVGTLISSQLGWPVVVLNRHRARGLAECRYGAGRNHSAVLYVGIGSGIAAGMFVDGRLLAGSVGGAGEVGHTTIHLEGPPCQCGNNGCLQAMAAGPALVQEARRQIRAGRPTTLVPDSGYDVQLLRVADVCRAAQEGDPLAVEVVEQAGNYLGVALANLVNTINPEVIVLGGSVPRRSPLYVEAAARTMRRRSLGPLAAATVVETALLAEAGGALGAANFALDHHIGACLAEPAPSPR